MALERRIYNGWAYTSDEEEKAQINDSIYQELLAQYWVVHGDLKNLTEEEKSKIDIIYESVGSGYATREYKVIKCPDEVTVDQLALIIDKGNLCFGYRGNKTYITIYID